MDSIKDTWSRNLTNFPLKLALSVEDILAETSPPADNAAVQALSDLLVTSN
ncbi:MAG: hypothetical protein QNJ36_14265 [Calothrix sp. MO_167.B42]|nr:hypothetical protein [Calothrix sp. MO_167.B42]